MLDYYPRPPLDRPRELAQIIGLCPASEQADASRPVLHPVTPTRMVTNPWRLVELHDLADVGAFLELSEGQLAWFSDPHHLARIVRQTPLQHYQVSTRSTPSGSVRVLEAPKYRLRLLQRRLLDQIIGRIPVHDATHGFRAGRSVAGYVAPHAGQALVMRLDLEGFFASVTVGRVYGVLRTAGYPEPDLAFSSPRDWRAGTTRLIDTVAQIARDEGFRLNARKTTVPRPHQRQRLGGLVINTSPSVSRVEIDRLRAILHNCARHGPDTQNRQGHPHFKAHLLRRIAWVTQHDPERGARPHAQFDAIDWSV